MKKLSLLMLFSILLLFLSSSLNAQGKLGTVGKSFTKEDANVLFGKVIGSIKIPKAEVEKAVEKADDYVLFAIKDNRVYVLNEKKFSLTELGVSLSKDDVAYIFSTEVVKAFLERTNGKFVTFELRYNSAKPNTKGGQYSTSAAKSGEIIFTVTGDNETLELSLPCPPMCIL